MFSLICVWINGWVNNREAGDLIRYRGHYDVIVMHLYFRDVLHRVTNIISQSLIWWLISVVDPHFSLELSWRVSKYYYPDSPENWCMAGEILVVRGNIRAHGSGVKRSLWKHLKYDEENKKIDPESNTTQHNTVLQKENMPRNRTRKAQPLYSTVQQNSYFFFLASATRQHTNCKAKQHCDWIGVRW